MTGKKAEKSEAAGVTPVTDPSPVATSASSVPVPVPTPDPDPTGGPKKKNDECVDPDLSRIPTGTTFTLCDGSLGTGTLLMPDSCAADGQQNCLTTTSFPAADSTAVAPRHLRFGKKIAGVTGTKKDCRNGATKSIFNYDGVVTSITTGGVTSGNAGDWWDTIDDSNNGNVAGGPGALPAPAAWNTDHYCDGSQLVDVTSTKSWLTPSNASINCASAGTATCTDADSYPFNKIYFDPWSELYFTNPLIKRGGAAAAGADWAEAVNACAFLESGDGAGKWRLPVQKELMGFYQGGISVPATSQFRPVNHEIYWVATSYLPGSTSGWWVNLLSGRTYGSVKGTNRYGVMCVREESSQ